MPLHGCCCVELKPDANGGRKQVRAQRTTNILGIAFKAKSSMNIYFLPQGMVSNETCRVKHASIKFIGFFNLLSRPFIVAEIEASPLPKKSTSFRSPHFLNWWKEAITHFVVFMEKCIFLPGAAVPYDSNVSFVKV